MSAWLVSNDTISKIANLISKEMEGYILESFADKKPQEIGFDLYNLNIRSLIARYGETAEKDFDAKGYAYTNVNFNNEYEAIKSISCYQYQACEGKRQYLSDLYRDLTEIKANLMERLISRDIPAYDQAEWK